MRTHGIAATDGGGGCLAALAGQGNEKRLKREEDLADASAALAATTKVCRTRRYVADNNARLHVWPCQTSRVETNHGIAILQHSRSYNSPDTTRSATRPQREASDDRVDGERCSSRPGVGEITGATRH
jgi:hypothetical protein